MRRIYLIFAFILICISTVQSQVINFGKTLPVHAYSFTVAPIFNIHSVYHPEMQGLTAILMGGYGIGYNVDMSIKYGNTVSLTADGVKNGPDFFGVDVQYLFRETRKSYYSMYGGIHKWEEYGIDMTVSYTYTPQYFVNLSAGLDMDVDFSNQLELRAWIPLNIGFNFDDRYFLFFEYDLPANEFAWDILGGGLTFIFR